MQRLSGSVSHKVPEVGELRRELVASHQACGHAVIRATPATEI